MAVSSKYIDTFWLRYFEVRNDYELIAQEVLG